MIRSTFRKWHREAQKAVPNPTKGFTLVELLVSLSVLTLIVVLSFGMVQLASNTWIAGRARADNFAKARSAMDLLSRELRASVLRADVVTFPNQTGTEGISFFTRQNGLRGERNLQFVDYSVRLPADATNPSEAGLIRRMTSWDYADKAAYSTALPNDPNAELQQIGPGIVFFAVRFEQRNGDLMENFLFDFEDPSDANNTHNARFACVVVDDGTLDLLIEAGKLTQVITALSSANSTNAIPPAKAWSDAMDELVATNVIPGTMRSGIRIFEQTIPLPLPHAI